MYAVDEEETHLRLVFCRLDCLIRAAARFASSVREDLVRRGFAISF